MSHYCGPVEFVLRAPEEWRAMPDDLFEASWTEFEKQMRAYREQHAAWRAKLTRFNPWLEFVA